VAGYRVTVRNGPRVEADRFGDLESALGEVEKRAHALQGEVSRRTVDLRIGRRFEPVQQVAARVELSGPGRLRAGVDVRGDGSAECYTGRLRRRLVEQVEGESPYDALRRAIAERF
jgi:hypothetical protein